MKLYYFETPNAFKPCAVAKHLDLDVELINVNLAKGEQKTPEFISKNPNGRIPVLEDGDTYVWESNAIMCYLARKANSDLFPDDDRQFEVLRWLFWDANHFSRHAQVFFFQNVIKPRFNLGDADQDALSEAAGFFNRFAAILDEQLANNTYVIGDTLTVADFALSSFLSHSEQSQLSISKFKNIQRWYKTLSALPAWQAPYPTDVASAA